MVVEKELHTTLEMTKIIWNTCLDPSTRKNWRETLEPYVKEINLERGYSVLSCKDGVDKNGFDYSECWSFLPEQLEPDYTFKFSIGDIVTNGEETVKIVELPWLDSRVTMDETYNPLQLEDYGNTYIVYDYPGDENDMYSLYLGEDYKLVD